MDKLAQFFADNSRFWAGNKPLKLSDFSKGANIQVARLEYQIKKGMPYSKNAGGDYLLAPFQVMDWYKAQPNDPTAMKDLGIAIKKQLSEDQKLNNHWKAKRQELEFNIRANQYYDKAIADSENGELFADLKLILERGCLHFCAENDLPPTIAEKMKAWATKPLCDYLELLKNRAAENKKAADQKPTPEPAPVEPEPMPMSMTPSEPILTAVSYDDEPNF